MAELIIFDCDGVLVDSEPVANRVMHDCLLAAGYDLSFEQCHDLFVGRTLDDCSVIVEERTGRPLPEKFMDDLEVATRLAFDKDLQPVIGIDAVLADTSHSVCVASSGSHAKIRHSLRLTSLDAYFSDHRIFSAEDVARGKPAPDLFLHAAAELGVQPQACIVIEDSRPGVDAAVAAGMTVLGFCERTPSHTLQAGGATVFRRMAELPGLLAAL